ncbi:hypothetical protein K9M59_02215 [Candidatus Gracilibacteria bacterium]|nr:hypothetical protein [Candidatus Gracilibacteria bacterium]MCF7819657.1 hypothetical protein [Candidatus Gracilibacteria bacterium]
MKKFFSSVLGLSLLAGALIPFADASREAYHNYLYRTAREKTPRYVSPHPFRPFSATRGSTRRLLQRETTPNRRGSNPIRNLRYPQQNTRSVYVPGTAKTLEEVRKDQLPLRPTTDRIALAWSESLRRRDPISFQTIRNAVEEFYTYENQVFSVQVPKGWRPLSSNPHFFRSPFSDYTISIVRLEDPCETVSFTTCAISLSKDRNYKNPAEKIFNISSISRQAQYSDTVLNAPEVQTRTFTESFAGRVGDEEKYISRYFVADLQGGVYVIETQVSLRNASQYIGISKHIFDTFRLYTPVRDL